jgi:hypothetical protein
MDGYHLDQLLADIDKAVAVRRGQQAVGRNGRELRPGWARVNILALTTLN